MAGRKSLVFEILQSRREGLGDGFQPGDPLPVLHFPSDRASGNTKKPANGRQKPLHLHSGPGAAVQLKRERDSKLTIPQAGMNKAILAKAQRECRSDGVTVLIFNRVGALVADRRLMSCCAAVQPFPCGILERGGIRQID